MVRKNKKKVTFLNTLLTVSVALLAGLLMTRIFKRFKLPAVTAYLIAGVLIGPFALGAIGIDGLGSSRWTSIAKSTATVFLRCKYLIDARS
ncbi:MAG: cation:proton antiporter [Clostridia bacterium]|nr:cation:proton antiporter [Clostridia bacterium]